ncbi:hypothetical protein BD408DRAFT_421012 [Parasitella parasitica]|nr:hypothetical protein BD408DRAFT_421012 [Parasitella parasitica]
MFLDTSRRLEKSLLLYQTCIVACSSATSLILRLMIIYYNYLYIINLYFDIDELVL